MVTDPLSKFNGRYCNKDDIALYAPEMNYAVVRLSLSPESPRTTIDIAAGTVFREDT